jgi:DNA-binding CsgD family transcriptional regulator
MRRLRQYDLHSILEIVEHLYSYRTLDACEAGIVRSLQRALDCDSLHISEADPKRRHVRWTSDWTTHRSVRIPNAREIFARHMHEHPFLGHWNSRGMDLEPARLSDLISRPSWHGTALYNEIFRPIRIEHMIGIALPSQRPRAVHVAGSRKTRDFNNRDRQVLGLLAPHLAAAYRHAETVEELEAELAALVQGFEANGRTAILLGPGRRIRQMSARAEGVLITYFRPHWADRRMLPAPVDDWLRRQMLTADAAVAPAPPLVAECDGRRLTIRILHGRGGPLLLLSERKLRVSPADIVSLGLSPRETEVLAWLCHGKSNAEIAGILGLSPLTIKHCLERVYAKLDVGTRAAATAIAVTAAGMQG